MSTVAYREVPLTQGTDEWHEWRNARITASNAAAAAGASPQWANRSTTDGFAARAMSYGSEHEDAVRDELAWSTGIDWRPACIERYANPMHASSLDGLADSAWAEIKTPFTQRRSVTWRLALEQKAPEWIWWQLAHQALTLGVIDGVDDRACHYAVAVPADKERDEPSHVLRGADWHIAHIAWPISAFSVCAQQLADRYRLGSAPDSNLAMLQCGEQPAPASPRE